jgi:hypothetical protein
LGKGLSQLTGQDTILTRAAFGVAVARYFWYLTWLKRHPGDENQPILLSDTRDVVLQGDPFQGLPSEKLFCGEEPVLLANCSGNALWYRCAYGSDALLRAGSNNVLCSGVIGGSRSRIMEYLECMCEEILRVGRRIVWAAGYDQALHNHLIRQGGIGHLFTVEPWNSNRLATLHYATDTAFTLREDGVLLGPSGNAVSIVHQYDRHERLQSWVNQRWGLNRSFVKQAN